MIDAKQRGTWNLLKLLKKLKEAFDENDMQHQRVCEVLQTKRLIPVDPPMPQNVESLSTRRQQLRS